MSTGRIGRLELVREVVRRKWKHKSVLKTMYAAADANINQLATIISFISGARSWTSEEAKALQAVNAIRTHCKQSTETVEVLDFGAGSSDANLSQAQMQAGILSQDKIADLYAIAATKAKWGELMFKIIRTFQPDNCLELGTSIGISAAYQMAALRANGKGRFVSIEGAPAVSAYAKNRLDTLNYDDFKLHNGRFMDVLPTILHQKNIDFLFIDGHHDRVATQQYYDMIYPYLTDQAIVIFDDIYWSKGMKAVWTDIQNNGQGIVSSVDLMKWGICFVDKNRVEAKRSHFNLFI